MPLAVDTERDDGTAASSPRHGASVGTTTPTGGALCPRVEDGHGHESSVERKAPRGRQGNGPRKDRALGDADRVSEFNLQRYGVTGDEFFARREAQEKERARVTEFMNDPDNDPVGWCKLNTSA